jgi:hypothetical protein
MYVRLDNTCRYRHIMYLSHPGLILRPRNEIGALDFWTCYLWMPSQKPEAKLIGPHTACYSLTVLHVDNHAPRGPNMNIELERRPRHIMKMILQHALRMSNSSIHVTLFLYLAEQHHP